MGRRQARHRCQPDRRQAQFAHGVEQVEQQDEEHRHLRPRQHHARADQQQETGADLDDGQAELGGGGRLQPAPAELQP